MATLASLLVVIGMDSTAMTAGAAKAQGSLAGLGASAKTMGAVVPLAAVAAGAAIVKFGADSVKAFEESQRVMAQTEAVLKSTGGAANVTATQVTGFAHTWQELTGVQDEAIQSSANLLLTFRDVHNETGRGNDIFNQAQVAILNMATALNRGATPAAEDLQKVTIQLGKALNDPIVGMTALRRVGVSFNASQVETIKKLQESGDLMGAQKIILSELSAEFGGAAKAAGDTFGGQVAKLGAKFDDLQEQIGAALVPALTDLVEGLSALITAFTSVTTAAGEFDAQLKQLGITGKIASETLHFALAPIPIKATEAGSSLEDLVKAEDHVAESSKRAAGELAPLPIMAGLIGDRFADLATHMPKVAKAFRDTRDALLAEIPALRGTTESFKDAFTLKPQELVHITNSWAKIARTIAHDLREIADSDLKPRMREAIAALPPEMRNAWVEGSSKQRSAIEASIQKTFSVQDQMPKLAREALTGGTTVGMALTQGIVRGLVSGSPAIDAAARTAVLKAIAAARAAAQAQSPSKKMAELGVDMMEGLVQGMLKAENKLLAAAEKVMGKLQDKLSNMLSKSSSFGQSIQGGFSSLLDISGAMGEGVDIQGFFQTQLSTARSFADVLRALQAQGAGKALLSAVAGKGPEAIPFAQQLLQSGPQGIAEVNRAYGDIASIAEKTADSLTNRFFGEKIGDLRQDVKAQKDVLVDIRGYVRALEKISDQLSSGKNGDIIINVEGSVMTERQMIDAIRDGLLKVGKHNVTAGIP